MRLDFLRKKYPQFVYGGYSYRTTGKDLKIVFNFQIEPDIQFRPEIIIKNIEKYKLKRIGDRVLNNLVFHLGLMEIPSYWKATCSPEIIIEAGYLNKDQIRWWKDLLLKGMGQFFYENKINWRGTNFLKIKSQSKKTIIKNEPRTVLDSLKDRYLVPVGGGRDSIVTLERFKKPTVRTQQKKEVNCFVVNPTRATKNVLRVAGIKSPIIVVRKIDPLLLKLNKKGFLNGHTPFTAVLSFLSIFCAVLFGYKNIVFSNEKSADEGNIKYLGKIINHQWSKSSEFERKFKNYCKKYLARNINYFSFLRPYTELEISKMFTKYPKYFPIFSSCNVASKITPPYRKRGRGGDRWCGRCPKCLFVYATLYSFLTKTQLLKIFGKDLFQNKELLPIMKSLIGQEYKGTPRAKPFECVGTYKESKKAFQLSLEKAKRSGKISFLLKKYNEIRKIRKTKE